MGIRGKVGNEHRLYWVDIEALAQIVLPGKLVVRNNDVSAR
jgi:hypothetical protein